ncbi:hypothetical protein K488DRAFT_89355 [Vararia minispora EC-137]|uniref:Uncharacterized protein n=1 Tax=Vararia minispora EC-137 TaxID=1314806 RepID=A0ACB8QC17_9AGAM|nr:hypothetical protein K488DRAFT_89355 [Vararia minispora EC-137]
MAPATRSRKDMRHRRSSVYVLITKPPPDATAHRNRRSRALSRKSDPPYAGDDSDGQDALRDARAFIPAARRVKRASRQISRTREVGESESTAVSQEPATARTKQTTKKKKGKVTAKYTSAAADLTVADVPPPDANDDVLQTPVTDPFPFAGLSDAQMLSQSLSLLSPPPPPKHRHIGKAPVSLDAALGASGTETPEEGPKLAEASVSLIASIVEKRLAEDHERLATSSSAIPAVARVGPPGAKGKWKIETTASTVDAPELALSRDYPFAADPSTSHKSPPRRPKAHRIGKKATLPESSSDGAPSIDAPVGEPTGPPVVPTVFGDIPLDREYATPAKYGNDRRKEPPPPPQPPSGSGRPLELPPAFRRLETPSISPRPTRPPHLPHRRQHFPPLPTSPLPPSSPPTEHSLAPSSDRIVEDVSFRNTDRDSFWPTDEQMYATGEDEDAGVVENVEEEEAAEHEEPDALTPRVRSTTALRTPIVNVLGIGVPLTVSRSFETPQRPRYGHTAPATSAKDAATAALFAPGMSDDSAASDVLDYEARAIRGAAGGAVHGAAKDAIERDEDEDDPLAGLENRIAGSDNHRIAADYAFAQEYVFDSDAFGSSDKENGENAQPAPDDAPRGVRTPRRDRGILQPHGGVQESSPRRNADDPFGILAAEARVKARRTQAQGGPQPAQMRTQRHPQIQQQSRMQQRRTVQQAPVSSPVAVSGRSRRPFGERSFADLNPPSSPPPAAFDFPPSSSPVAHPTPTRAATFNLPPSSPPAVRPDPPSSSPRYSRSSIEDLYATPPSQRGFGLVMSTPLRPRPKDDEDDEDGNDENAPVSDDAPRTPLAVRIPTAARPLLGELRTPLIQRTPMTPRNGNARSSVTMRRHKLRGADASASFNGADEGSIDEDGMGPREPSPSPAKRRGLNPDPNVEYEEEKTEGEKEKGKNAVREKDREREREPPTRGKENAVRTRGTGTRKRKTPQDGDEEDEDPMAVTKRLEGMLPRRGTKYGRPAAKRARTKLAELSDSEDEDEERISLAKKSSISTKAAPVKKPGRKATYGRRGKRAARRAGREDSTPEEKRKQDRKDRAKYFKKLEDYKLRKEKVYVV